MSTIVSTIDAKQTNPENRDATVTRTASLALFAANSFTTHHPKAGINPLVDAAAYLFSLIGQLKKTIASPDLQTLQKELIHEMTHFQETAKMVGYPSDYIVIARYALCATLDDIIAHAGWSENQWDQRHLTTTFTQEPIQQDRFFLILERICQNPETYIDAMELMYLCLSLGYKGSYRATEQGQTQLEQMTHLLYKNIRLHRGNFNKTLSPFPIKPVLAGQLPSKKIPGWGVVVMSLLAVGLLFVGLSYLLDSFSNRAYDELMQIGKTILYEAHD